MMMIRYLALAIILVVISACSSVQKNEQDSAPSEPVDWEAVRSVVPKNEPYSRYGNPESYEVYGITYRVLKSSEDFKQTGVASWYGTKFHGRRTSSGEPYDMLKLTAAHKILPIPSYVRVTNHDNGRSLIVRVNDRGPFVKSRIIDLSYAAAHKLAMTEKGTANVSIEVINFGKSIVSQSQDKTNKKPIQTKDINKKPRFVQVGAYSKHQSAQKLAKVLDREIDLPVNISPITRLGRKLFRVRIGPIDSLQIAEELAKILNIKELGKPTIVYQD